MYVTTGWDHCILQVGLVDVALSAARVGIQGGPSELHLSLHVCVSLLVI